MKLGLFTAVYGSLSVDKMIEKTAALGIEALELGAGGFPGNPHLPVDELLANPSRAQAFVRHLADNGMSISALSCHGNPLHPDRDLAERDDATFRRTVLLAERLNVKTVVTFSGCPGDRAGSKVPNWVVTPWPPEFSELLAWQWEEVAIPYWREAAEFSRSHGVRVALEAHPGFLVYNPETLLRLRAAVGDNLGINFDPSHLFWQGVHIPTAIAALGDSIFHVHAKDLAFQQHTLSRNGVLDAKSYRNVAERSWNFRTVGFGHGEQEWREILSALRTVQYDGAISIEHEDPLLSVDEGVRFAVDLLKKILPREPAAEAWWA
ncbi:sugar phosphate isomerase/epimerase [Granulicella sp. S156]|jgi:sugar phosphate isomerase/epimerase|uniref:sugar phosphate isomerase/epimerase family protein n=1 Tax=Granulicella sp. S156 TaxID=1747224 RepID=UPI00131D2C0F|nr:sugar phosphate isomerase/epimerase [Granulicella sp. S156]